MATVSLPQTTLASTSNFTGSAYWAHPTYTKINTKTFIVANGYEADPLRTIIRTKSRLSATIQKSVHLERENILSTSSIECKFIKYAVFKCQIFASSYIYADRTVFNPSNPKPPDVICDGASDYIVNIITEYSVNLKSGGC